MKNLLRFLGLGLVFATSLSGFATHIELYDGDEIEIRPNRYSTVTCSAEGSEPFSCEESCQRWYTLREYVNGQWQSISHCAFRIRCEETNRGCFRKTSCEQFQSTRTYIHGQWQTVVSCAGTTTLTTCGR